LSLSLHCENDCEQLQLVARLEFAKAPLLVVQLLAGVLAAEAVAGSVAVEHYSAQQVLGFSPDFDRVDFGR
jgi:hypothetical protein